MDVANRTMENGPMPGIRIARTAADIDAVRELFREYARGANAPACFVTFEDEIATLPGDYALPSGRLLLAVDAEPAGCVALRSLEANTANTAEIKRLYVRATFRGTGLGRALAMAAIEAARESGARRVVLDTLPSMVEAQRLYRSLGFREIAPYLAAPTPCALCFELPL